MDPVRCAVIGIGMMGSEHVAILAASPSAELVVCCDLDASARRFVPDGVAFTASMDEALATPGLEAVFICTPQAHHLAAVRAATALGLAIFCEKPIAADVADADAIVVIAGAYRPPLVFGHMMRFDPRYMALKEAIGEGRIGVPVHVSQRGNVPDYEGRIIAGRTTLAAENCVHALDLFRWLFGEIERVYGESSSTGILGEGLVDAMVATIRFASGAVGTVESNWIMPTDSGIRSEHHFSVVGSTGLAYIDARDSGVGIFSSGRAPSFPGTLAYRDPAGSPYGLYRTEVEYFLATVREPRPWPNTPEDARAALIVALAIDRSIAETRPVRISEVQ